MKTRNPVLCKCPSCGAVKESAGTVVRCSGCGLVAPVVAFSPVVALQTFGAPRAWTMAGNVD